MLTNDERCRNNLIHNYYIICQKKEADTEDKHTYKSKETKNRKAK